MYYIDPSGKKIYLMYFAIDRNYPNWPIFLEQDSSFHYDIEFSLPRNHECLLNVVHDFFRVLENKNRKLYKTVKQDENHLCRGITG